MLLPPQHQEKIPRLLQEAVDAHTKSLFLTSGESYSGAGDNILNRIHFYQKENFDIWLMDQQVAGQKQDGHQIDDHIAIVVEKGASADTAYYFQYEIQNQKINPIPFHAACYRCHANGPRTIRPQKSKWSPDFNSDEEKLLKSWNGSIANYGVIETYWPHYNLHSDKSPIKINDPHQEEPLALTKCVGCHNSQTGQRAVLQRQHQDSIIYLINHGWDENEVYSIETNNKMKAHMPLGKEPLSPGEKQRLIDWLNQ